MIYLDVPFREKDQAKQLGARWDAVTKRWYIPDESLVNKNLFSRWLPEQQNIDSSLQMENVSEQNHNLNPSDKSRVAMQLAVSKSVDKQFKSDSSLQLNESKHEGISLSQMLSKVQKAIRVQLPGAVWVVAEIANLNSRRGHIYLELVETNSLGQTVASCRSMIWQRQASSLTSVFESQTGSELKVGQKLLLLVEASFHHQFGFSLVIQDIDPSYTLGEQERKLNEIRKSLLTKGIYALNKEHPLPKDFFRIAVIAPIQAAGLGDFRADADILQKNGLCEFKYFYSSFQGNSAETELLEALQAVTSLHKSNAYDALVIIRGGGAKLDLNQLNIEVIAEKICHLPIPVLSGIGHERDNTIIDEVAHTRLDTPSKVIAFIQQQIFEQAKKAKTHWQSIEKSSEIRVHYLHNQINQQFARIQNNSQSVVYSWQNKLEPLDNNIRHLSYQSISQTEKVVESQIQFIENQVRHSIERKKIQTDQFMQRTTENAKRAIETQNKQLIQSISFILSSGPKVQLNRGFTIVKNNQGTPLTKATEAIEAKEIQIEFSDGSVVAEVK